MSANEQRDGIEGLHRSGAGSVTRPDAEGGALARWRNLLRIAALVMGTPRSGLPAIPRHPGEARYPGEGNSGKMREPFQAIGVHRRKRDPLRRVVLFVLCRR
jgi:hypothetical protein